MNGIDGKDGIDGISIKGKMGEKGYKGDRGSDGLDGEKGDEGMYILLFNEMYIIHYKKPVIVIHNPLSSPNSQKYICSYLKHFI